MSDQLIVVGGGLFGSIFARAAEARGFDVRVLDARLPRAGSKAAGCVIRPSWITGIGGPPGTAEAALLHLNEVSGGGLRRVPFHDDKDKPLEGYAIEPESLLWKAPAQMYVTEVRDGSVVAQYSGRVRIPEEHPPAVRMEGTIVVAAGWWSRALLKGVADVPMRGLVGASLIMKGKSKPHVVTYAPYKQAVWFPKDDGTTWFGDGTAIRLKNYGDDHTRRTIERAFAMGLTPPVLHVNEGIRPYCGEQGYFRKLGDRLYVTTGGAKNGSVLGAVQSMMLLRELTK